MTIDSVVNKIYNSGDQINAQYLHNRVKIVCLNGLSIEENKSIKFQYVNDLGNRVYYATQSGFEKLTKKYKVNYVSNKY
jgi:hypothetical protein